MKFKSFTILKHKPYLFSVAAFMLVSIGASLPAYSQVDYYYGVNNKGFRIGIGGGGAALNSNWNKQMVQPTGVVSIDYDFSRYVSLGIQGQFGKLQGVDDLKKFTYEKTENQFAAGNVNLHVAVGAFTKFQPKNLFQDAVKKLYLGVGVGVVHSSVTLYDRYDGAVVSNPNSAFIERLKDLSGGRHTESGSFTAVPVSIGTYIPLRGLFGNDKIDLNPAYQHSFVQSPVFDGYQPSAVDSGPYIKKNGNQAYSMVTLSIRYKF